VTVTAVRRVLQVGSRLRCFTYY